MNTLIDLINVSKTYDSRPRPSLDGVSLRIPSGDVTAKVIARMTVRLVPTYTKPMSEGLSAAPPHEKGTRDEE
jgi:hypothetical protein